MRMLLLLVPLAMNACTDRSLGLDEPAGTAQRDLGGLNQALVDAAHSDSAAAPSDAGVGVPCGTTVCTGDTACCVLPPGTRASCVSPPQLSMCLGSNGFRCDGPEDCPTGRHCLATFDSTVIDLIATRCGRQPGPSEEIVCHADADCPVGDICAQAAVSFSPGEPPLGVCVVLGP